MKGWDRHALFEVISFLVEPTHKVRPFISEFLVKFLLSTVWWNYWGGPPSLDHYTFPFVFRVCVDLPTISLGAPSTLSFHVLALLLMYLFLTSIKTRLKIPFVVNVV